MHEMKEEKIFTESPSRNRQTGTIYIGRDLIGRILLPTGVTDVLPDVAVPSLILDVNVCKKHNVDTKALQTRFKESFLMSEQAA